MEQFLMDNEYTRKEKVCPLIGNYCNEEHRDCDRVYSRGGCLAAFTVLHRLSQLWLDVWRDQTWLSEVLSEWELL